MSPKTARGAAPDTEEEVKAKRRPKRRPASAIRLRISGPTDGTKAFTFFDIDGSFPALPFYSIAE
jgi:hypothetical protein